MSGPLASNRLTFDARRLQSGADILMRCVGCGLVQQWNGNVAEEYEPHCFKCGATMKEKK